MEPNFKFIDSTGPAFDAAIKYLSSLNSIAVDTETTGVDPFIDKILLISAGDAACQYVFDVARLEKDLTPFFDILRNPNVVKILHNAKFDYKFFKKMFNVAIEPLYDTMIAEMLLLKGRKVQGFGLDDVADKYVNVKMEKDIRKTFIYMMYGDKFTDEQVMYSAVDVQFLHKIRNEQLKFIRKHSLEKVTNIEMDAIPAVADMELFGVYIDKDLWLKAETAAKEHRAEAQKKLNEFFITICGVDMFGNPVINYNSPKQLLPALKKIIGKKAEGLTSTAEAAVKDIDHPVIKALLDYRESEKRISTYGASFLENAHPLTLRIHSDFNQLYADTGRFSSSNPNLQNIPREKVYREAFTAGDPNYRLITVDYSGMELRILADLSMDPIWIECFERGGDLHCEEGSRISGVVIRKKGTLGPDDPGENAELRQPYKSLNFGISYGMGPRKFSKTTGIDYEKAKSSVYNFWKLHPKIKNFFDVHVAKSIDAGAVKCPYDGRLRWLDGFDLDSQKEQARVRNMCMNFPMQAGNATITKRALTILRQHLIGKDAHIIGTVHDEIIVRTHKDIADEVYKIVVDDMISAAKEFIKNVPVEVEGKIAYCWSK